MSLASRYARIAVAVGAKVGAPFYAGQIIVQAGVVFDDGGSIVTPAGPAYRDCQVQIVSLDDRARPEGWTDKDYSFVILAGMLTGNLDTDARVRITDAAAPADFRKTWTVSGLQRDPAGIGYTGKGTAA